MFNFQKANFVLLAFLCALFSYQFLLKNPVTNVDKAYASGGSSNDELIVVPFMVDMDTEKLAVFKKEDISYKGKKLQNEWAMAIYGCNDRGQLKFEACRWIGNDFFLKSFGIYEKRDSTFYPDKLREIKEKGIRIFPDDDKAEEKKEPLKKSELYLPDWFVKPPKKVGKNIYVLNVFPLESLNELSLGTNASVAEAKKEFVGSIKIKLERISKEYSSKLSIQIQKDKFNVIAQNLIKELCSVELYKSVLKQHILLEDADKKLLFCQIEISFTEVEKKLSDAVMKEFEQIDEIAKEAFDEMKKYMNSLTESAYYTESAKKYLPE